MHVAAGRVVVRRFVGADDAGERFGQRRLKIGVTVIRQQAVHLHHLAGDDDVRCLAADIGKRIPGRFVFTARNVERGLNTILLPRLDAIAPLGPDFKNGAAEFVAHQNRILGDVFRHPFMRRALFGRFVRRHADPVRLHFRQNLVVFERRQFVAFQPKVVGPVQSQPHCLHSDLAPVMLDC